MEKCLSLHLVDDAEFLYTTNSIDILKPKGGALYA